MTTKVASADPQSVVKCCRRCWMGQLKKCGIEISTANHGHRYLHYDIIIIRVQESERHITWWCVVHCMVIFWDIIIIIISCNPQEVTSQRSHPSTIPGRDNMQSWQQIFVLHLMTSDHQKRASGVYLGFIRVGSRIGPPQKARYSFLVLD